MRAIKFARRIAGVLFLMAAFIAVPSGAQENQLRILSPATGTIVRPGQTINISVAADASVEETMPIGLPGS